MVYSTKHPEKILLSEEFESYEKMPEEHFDVSNVAFYRRNKDWIPIIIVLLGFNGKGVLSGQHR